MSCWIALNPTVDDIKDFQYCLIAERQVKAVVIWKPLVEKYFEQKDVKKALRIIYCESRGKSTAIGINKDKSKDVGLWQFNDNTWAWLKPKLKITSTRFMQKFQQLLRVGLFIMTVGIIGIVVSIVGESKWN